MNDLVLELVYSIFRWTSFSLSLGSLWKRNWAEKNFNKGYLLFYPEAVFVDIFFLISVMFV